MTGLSRLGIISATVLAVGLAETLVHPYTVEAYAFPFQRDAFIQLGGLGILVFALVYVLRRVSPRATDGLVSNAKSLLPKLLVALVLFFLTAEVGCRLVYWDGMSFGSHTGPIIRRFERNYRLNRFDGSRGPECGGPKKPGSVRLLVQGDSITWGFGLKSEEEMYSTRLLTLLQADNPDAEMAVIARSGREVDGHLQQLLKHGDRLQPDVIIYQWYINDLELSTKDKRPWEARAWQKLFFHRVLLQTSYFYYLLDYKLDANLPGPSRSYLDYLVAYYEADTPEWQEFESTFRLWALGAKRLTPRVVVMMYPMIHDPEDYRLDTIYEKVRRLCRELEVELLDLNKVLEDVRGNPAATSATPYDVHPNAMVHERMARSIYERLLVRWPALFQASGKDE